MKVLQFIGAIALSLSALAANAQTTVNVGTSQDTLPPTGVYTETWMKHLNCAAYQPSGTAVFYKVKSNRPDLFFEDLDLVRKCLAEVKTSLENPSKNRQKIKVLFAGAGQSAQLPPFSAVANTPAVNCMTMQNERRQELLYEFSFPYFSSEEMAIFTHETSLRTCLHQARPVSQDTRNDI